MCSILSACPEGTSSILVVARDYCNRWQVQEALGRLRRHFATFDAAMDFARHAPAPFVGASVAISSKPADVSTENARETVVTPPRCDSRFPAR